MRAGSARAHDLSFAMGAHPLCRFALCDDSSVHTVQASSLSSFCTSTDSGMEDFCPFLLPLFFVSSFLLRSLATQASRLLQVVSLIALYSLGSLGDFEIRIGF